MGSYFAEWEQFIIEYFIFIYYITHRTTLCTLCKRRHFHVYCLSFVKMYVSERHAHAKALWICRNYSRFGHQSSTYFSQARCTASNRHAPHHTPLDDWYTKGKTTSPVTLSTKDPEEQTPVLSPGSAPARTRCLRGWYAGWRRHAGPGPECSQACHGHPLGCGHEARQLMEQPCYPATCGPARSVL